MLAVVIVVVVVVLVLTVSFAYNSLVRGRNRTAEAWSQIDVELKRRHDLIPNLVSTVKGYAEHERGTFEAVTEARASAVTAGAAADPRAVSSAESALNTSLRSLFAVAESYPALRAEEGFLDLQAQLAASEDKLEYARHFYNASARDYDSALQSFPRNLLAGAGGFRRVEFFEANDADRALPTVDFVASHLPSA